MSTPQAVELWDSYSAAVATYNREWGAEASHKRPLPEPVRITCAAEIARLEGKLRGLLRTVHAG